MSELQDVSFMFDEKGQIIIDKEECDMDSDDLMMLALDAGAEDFNEEEDSYEVLTSPEDFSDVRLKLEEEGIAMASAEVTMIPQTYVDLTKEEDIKNIQKTQEFLLRGSAHSRAPAPAVPAHPAPRGSAHLPHSQH